MSPLMNISTSGMQAAQLRLNASANNVANSQTDGFRADRVQQQAQAGGGVTAQVEKLPTPGVNLLEERVEQMSASLTFKANAQMVKTWGASSDLSRRVTRHSMQERSTTVRSVTPGTRMVPRG